MDVLLIHGLRRHGSVMLEGVGLLGLAFRFTIRAGQAQLPPARDRNLLGVQAELADLRAGASGQ